MRARRSALVKRTTGGGAGSFVDKTMQAKGGAVTMSGPWPTHSAPGQHLATMTKVISGTLTKSILGKMGA